MGFFMNLMIVDFDGKISHSRYVFTFRLPPQNSNRDRFPALEIRKQYYGFSKVVTDPWKNHNIVRGYRCDGGGLY